MTNIDVRASASTARVRPRSRVPRERAIASLNCRARIARRPGSIMRAMLRASGCRPLRQRDPSSGEAGWRNRKFDAHGDLYERMWRRSWLRSGGRKAPGRAAGLRMARFIYLPASPGHRHRAATVFHPTRQLFTSPVNHVVIALRNARVVLGFRLKSSTRCRLDRLKGPPEHRIATRSCAAQARPSANSRIRPCG